MANDSESDEDATTNPDEGRELGVDLGSLETELEGHDYPATAEELVTEYGDREIGLPSGSTTFGDVLAAGGDREFESWDAVHQAVLNGVGSEAVGREGYSDRGGSDQGESGGSPESL